MALKIIIKADEHEALSEDLKKEYKKQNDGSFILDTVSVDGFAVENVSGLKKSLEAARGERDRAMEKLKSFGDLDPESARTAITKLAELGDGSTKIEERVKAATEQIGKLHKTELEKVSGRAEGLRKQLEKILVDNAALEALNKAKAKASLLMPHLRSQIRTRELDNGQFVVEVVGADGNVRVGDAQGNPMTIPQLVEEMSKDETFAVAFPGTGQTGSGQTGNNAPSGAGSGSGGSGGTGGKPVMGSIRIKRNDQDAVNAHWEQIASGEAVVVD